MPQRKSKRKDRSSGENTPKDKKQSTLASYVTKSNKDKLSSSDNSSDSECFVKNSHSCSKMNTQPHKDLEPQSVLEPTPIKMKESAEVHVIDANIIKDIHSKLDSLPVM